MEETDTEYQWFNAKQTPMHSAGSYVSLALSCQYDEITKTTNAPNSLQP